LTTRQHNDIIGLLPELDSSGRLPIGIHDASWDEFERRFGWNERRKTLIAGLREAGDLLYRAGCRKIYIDGSFITSRELPGDFDACWDESGVNTNFLHRIAPELFDMRNKRAAQKAKFGGEFRPAMTISGSSRKTFLDFFQFDTRTQTAKGIIRIYLGGPRQPRKPPSTYI
jgi:hypothetical protein